MNSTYNNLEELITLVGKNIRTIREYKKITQTHLYEYLGKSQATLSRYENGQSVMSLATLYEISSFLNVPINTLLTQELSFEDCVEIEKSSKVLSTQKIKHILENQSLNLYYMSTSKLGKVIEAPLITAEKSNENYIPFLFEVKHNSPDKQIYEGKLIVDGQHAYFYIENTNRNERGLIITYSYPQKNKTSPIGLLGLMISISHGYEQRPCTQNCIISSEKIDITPVKFFLKLNLDTEFSEYIDFLNKEEDKRLYEWISGCKIQKGCTTHQEKN